jgi:hypothetical protein
MQKIASERNVWGGGAGFRHKFLARSVAGL